MSISNQFDSDSESDEEKHPWLYYFALGFMGATIALTLLKLIT